MSQIIKSQASQQPQFFNPKKYLDTGLTEEEIIDFKESFDFFDIDGTGSIDPSELKIAMKSLGFEGKNQIILQLIDDLDTDKNKQIEFQEFINLMTQKMCEHDTKDDIQKVFDLFADPETNVITLKDLRNIAIELGEQTDENELQIMIDQADIDKDGIIQFDDFYHIIMKKFNK